LGHSGGESFCSKGTEAFIKMVRSLVTIVVIAATLAGCVSQSAKNFSDALMNSTEASYIDSLGGTSAFSTLDSETLQYLCAAYAQSDDFSTAVDCYDVHIQRFYHSTVRLDNFITMNVLYSRSYMAFELGEFADAITFAEMDIDFMARHDFAIDSFLVGPSYGSKLISLHAMKLMSFNQLGRSTEEEATYQTLQGFVPWVATQPRIAKDGNVITRLLLHSRMAVAYVQTGRFEQAANLFSDDEDSGRQKTLAVLNSIATFGGSAVANARSERALKRFDQGPYYIGKAALEGGRFDEALAQFTIVDSYDMFDINRARKWAFLHDFGRSHQALGNTDKSIELFSQAIEIFESQRSSLRDERGKIGFVGNKQAVYADLVSALMDQRRYAEAFSYAERGKARALVDVLASKKSFGNSSSGGQNRLITELDEAEKSTRQAAMFGEDVSKTRGLVIASHEAISQQAPELASLVTVGVPQVETIQSLLPVGETLIEYYGSGENLVAFIVTRDDVQGVRLNGEGLAREVSAFRKALINVNSTNYQRFGDQLYNRLLRPLGAALGTKQITIVPHGALHYLPFSALTDGGSFVVDRFAIRMLPSASVLLFLKQNNSSMGSLLALGNPDLGDADYDLPFAGQEVRRISEQVAGAKLLTRGQATESALKRYGNSFRYLHLASHGTFDAERPLLSGLLLVGDSQNDGILTVGELYDLQLNADLVTLSACETALGKVASGDDVVGFTRGFLYAGASSIISSLWQVDDAATSDLMTGFYARLAGTDKRSALRQAQLATKTRYGHPYYWAAFQLTGAIDSL
jgi:CHAT domain-containing protein